MRGGRATGDGESMSTLLLLSGGLDSALLLARDKPKLAIGFDYGQPHLIELDYARKLAARYGVPFQRYKLPFVPLIDDIVFAARNALMLSAAAAVALEAGCNNIMIGCNASDASRFPDCRENFLYHMTRAFERAYGISIIAPLAHMTKAQIIAEAKERGVAETWTCYAPLNGHPCGSCYACESLRA